MKRLMTAYCVAVFLGGAIIWATPDLSRLQWLALPVAVTAFGMLTVRK